MTYKIYTYNKALELVKPNLKILIKKRKLHEFYRTYKNDYHITYHTLQQLASDTNKKEFPDTLFALLNIFGYKTVRTKAFKIFDNKNNNNNTDINFDVE